MSDTPAPRVLLATKFPEQFVRDTVVPGLRDLGLDVVRTVGTDFDGDIKNCDVIAFMFQYCSHSSYDNFKRRAKQAGVPLMLLSRKQAEWPAAFRTAGVTLPQRSVIVANGKPLLPPPPPPKPPTPKTTTFGAALKEARKEEGVTQAFVAEMCGVVQNLVSLWETDKVPMASDCYGKLKEIFPALKDVPPPEFARKKARPGLKPAGAPPAAPEPAPAALPPKVVNGHRHALPLAGLRLAARALGIVGPVTVTIDDSATDVRVGDGTWTMPAPDEAVEAARGALDERLRELLGQIEAARQSLAGAS